MYAKPADWRQLPKGSQTRAVFRLAARATANTILGGASALVIAKRAVRMQLPTCRAMLAAVSDCYATSSGHIPAHLTPWECGECGTIHSDQDDAAACCSESEEGGSA